MPKKTKGVMGITWNPWKKTKLNFDGVPSYYRTGTDTKGKLFAESRIGKRRKK